MFIDGTAGLVRFDYDSINRIWIRSHYDNGTSKCVARFERTFKIESVEMKFSGIGTVIS